MLNYKRAEKLAPEKPEFKHSIQLTNGRLIDRFSRLPEPFWISISQKFYSVRTIKPLTLLGLLMYVVGIVLIAFRMWRSTDNAWIRRGYSTLLFIGIPLLAGGLLTSYKTANNQGAVVMVNQTGLFDEPTDDSQISSKASDLQIHAGLVVKLEQSVENWSQVVLPNGVSGWVRSDTIETI